MLLLCSSCICFHFPLLLQLLLLLLLLLFLLLLLLQEGVLGNSCAASNIKPKDEQVNPKPLTLNPSSDIGGVSRVWILYTWVRKHTLVLLHIRV